MNVYNQFLEKIKHKNRINNILYEDINDKLLSRKDRKTPINLLLSTRPALKENINKIKLKYGYSQNIHDQENIHHRISQLKDKYFKNSSNKYKINNVNIISYINNDKKKNFNQNENESFKNNNRIKGHSFDSGKMRINTNSFYNNINNNVEKEKISLGLSSEQIMNNINNNSILNIVDNQNLKEKKESDYENYVKSARNDFNLIDKKVNEILQNERISPEKKNKFNNIYPISQRINMLNNIKNELKVVNKNFENSYNNNSSNSQISGSFTTIGFKYINPKLKRTSIYNNIFGNKNDDGSIDFKEISKENELDKPNLIRGLSKPKLKVMRFSKFFEVVEE